VDLVLNMSLERVEIDTIPWILLAKQTDTWHSCSRDHMPFKKGAEAFQTDMTLELLKILVTGRRSKQQKKRRCVSVL